MHSSGRLALAAGFVLAASPASAFQSHHDDAPSVFGSAEEEVSSLANNLDNTIKLCTEESGKAAAGRTELGPAEKRSVERGLLTWVADPPQALKDQAQARYGAARFGRWLDPHATIWVIAYAQAPTCRILVGTSPWTKSVRPTLYAKLQDDHFWKIDDVEKPIGEGLVRTTFHADLANNVNVQPMVTITAPVAPKDGATQLSIGVYVINKEEK